MRVFIRDQYCELIADSSIHVNGYANHKKAEDGIILTETTVLIRSQYVSEFTAALILSVTHMLTNVMTSSLVFVLTYINNYTEKSNIITDSSV